MDDLFLDISAPQSPQSNVEVGWYDCTKALLTQVIAQHTVMLAADFLKEDVAWHIQVEQGCSQNDSIVRLSRLLHTKLW
jgi:hypothetical protein